MMLITDEKIKRKWKKMRQEAEVEGNSVIVLGWMTDDCGLSVLMMTWRWETRQEKERNDADDDICLHISGKD